MSKLHGAVASGDIRTLKQATKKECDQGDEIGVTPTLLAAFIGNADALRTLIARGGSVDKCDLFGNTALHLAAQKGHLHILKVLVECGANIFALDNDKQTALDIAVMSRFDNAADFLDRAKSERWKLNPSGVRKLQEKADNDANKRIKSVEKRERSQSRPSITPRAQSVTGTRLDSTMPDLPAEGEPVALPNYFSIVQTHMMLPPPKEDASLEADVESDDDAWQENDQDMFDDDDLEVLAINVFLEANKLTDLIPYLHQEKIDLESLLLLSEKDLDSIGIQLGPRKKLLAAIDKRRKVIQAQGDMPDTDL